MRFVELNQRDKVLVAKATALLKRRESVISTVSAGIRTPRDKEYYGISVELKSTTIGMCAEFSAIGAMVSGGDRSIGTMVAITRSKGRAYRVLPPCGRCRELAQKIIAEER